MTKSIKHTKATRKNERLRLKVYFFVIFFAWTSIVAAFLLWNIYEEERGNFDNLIIMAESHISKEELIRKWFARHNDFYVQKSNESVSDTIDNNTEEDIISSSCIKEGTLETPCLIGEFFGGQQSQNGISIKFTSIMPVNSLNQSDDWEQNALQNIKDKNEFYSYDTINGEKYFRLIEPYYVETSCLKCHISQQYNVGDIIGGTSITIPIKLLMPSWERHLEVIYITNFMTWFFGIIILMISYISLKGNIKNREIIFRDLSAAKKNADEANQTKSQFIANMSHEIRTPMNAIIGFTEILKDKVTDIESKRHLEAIESSSNSMLRLINDILDISKIDAGKLSIIDEPVDISSFMKDIDIAFAYRAKQKNIEFSIEIDKSLPNSIMIDDVRLRQILFNIVGNAIKFTEYGFVKIIVSKISEIANTNRIGVEFSIKDTGIGIPIENQGFIFEAFHQQPGLDYKFGGTGLGLAISKRLADIMDAKIIIESEIGIGSMFIVQFKDIAISSPNDEKDKTLDNSFRKVKFDNATLLIVDDNKLNRILIKEFLVRTEINIIEAENGKEAIELIELYSPNIVLMDLKMPVMDGIDCTKIIRSGSGFEKMPIIACPASTIRKEKEQFIEIGFTDFLEKPFTKNKLYELLTNYLNFSEIQTKIIESKISYDTLTPEIIENIKVDKIENIETLIFTLENELFQEYETIKKTSIINDILTFAEKIKILGESNKVNLLIDYGEQLLTTVKTFDFDKINITLNLYPAIVRKFINM